MLATTLLVAAVVAASVLTSAGVVVTAYLALTAVCVAERHAWLGCLTRATGVTAVLRDLSIGYAGLAVAVAAGLFQPVALRDAVWILLASALVVTAVVAARRRLRGALRVLVLGDRATIAQTPRWTGAAAADKVRVVGELLFDADAPEEHGVGVIGAPRTVTDVDEVAQWVEAWQPDVVVVPTGSGLTGLDVRRLAWRLEESRVGLAFVDLVDGIAPHRLQTNRVANSTFVNLLPSRPRRLVRFGKAVADRVTASILLLLASPFIGLAMLLVRLDSRGPGIFRQVRVGKDGAPFMIYKLRTMCLHAERERDDLVDDDEGAGLLFKIRKDPRVTRVGAFLRRTSLDELPQLLNVVRGEMSLVGPRPALPLEVAAYDEIERRRLAVRPGMTGLWQVSGRSDLSWQSAVDLDLHYTDNWRLRGDVMIGLRTFGAVVRGGGAY